MIQLYSEDCFSFPTMLTNREIKMAINKVPITGSNITSDCACNVLGVISPPIVVNA